MDKSRSEEDVPSTETVAAALIHLLAHYQGSRCPRVAICIARHLQCLAMDPAAAPVMRGVCRDLLRSWGNPACGEERPRHALPH